MGEIYRSASVTGSRRLNVTRSEAVGKVSDERHDDIRQPNSVKPVVPEAAPRLPAVAEDNKIASGVPVPLSDVEHLQALSAIQEKHIAQLELEKGELFRDCQELAAEADRLRVELDARNESQRSQAYELGLQQAHDEVTEQRQTSKDEIDQLRQLFDTNMQNHLRQVDEFAVEIAFAALSRVVGDHYEDPQFIQAAVNQALAGVRQASDVSVRVSHHDFKLIQTYTAGAKSSQFAHMQLIADHRVSVGGCLIDTETGIWDARFETQLQRLHDAIEYAVQGGLGS